MIEWCVSDAKFDFSTYFFSTLSEEELTDKVNAIALQYDKYFEDHDFDVVDLVGSRSGGLAISKSFRYDEKSKKLLTWDPQKRSFSPDKSLVLDLLFCADAPNLQVGMRSVLEFGCPNHDFDEAPFQVSVYKNILSLDPKGIFYDGESFFTSKEFLQDLEPYESLDIFEDSSGENPALFKKEEYAEPQLGDLIMSGWEAVQNLPFKKTLFRDEVLSGKEGVKKIFEAVVRNPLVEDKVLQNQLRYSEKEFQLLKIEISQMINRILADESDS